MSLHLLSNGRVVVVFHCGREKWTRGYHSLLFDLKQIHDHTDINTFFALKFDRVDSMMWLRISAVTLTLSLTVMAFIKIFMVWLLPESILGLAVFVMTLGFFMSAGACEAVVTNAFGHSGVCS